MKKNLTNGQNHEIINTLSKRFDKNVCMPALDLTGRGMATISDVARMAGVSISTVSYAISGTRPISAEKKALIFQRMKELGYQPNAIAKSLASSRTHNIALLYPPVGSRPLGLIDTQFISFCARYSLKKGYSMVLWVISPDGLEELRKLIRQGMVDGIVLMEVRQRDPFVRVLHEENIPFFMVGHDQSFKGGNYVDIDYYSSMKSMISLLVSRGHRNICFLNHPRGNLDAGYTPTILCHECFNQVCAGFGIQGREVFCDSDPGSGLQAAKKLLEENSGITVFISSNESCLAGIIRAVEDSGRKIPRDVSLVAFTNTALAGERLLPLVTTCEIDVDSMMRRAIDELILCMEKSPGRDGGRLIPCRLVERQSTCPADGEA